MCACGRKRAPEVLTSAQAEELAALRSAQELEQANRDEAARIASAQAAVANATSGWYVV